jgi:hypothetical protein
MAERAGHRIVLRLVPASMTTERTDVAPCQSQDAVGVQLEQAVAV